MALTWAFVSVLHCSLSQQVCGTAPAHSQNRVRLLATAIILQQDYGAALQTSTASSFSIAFLIGIPYCQVCVIVSNNATQGHFSSPWVGTGKQSPPVHFVTLSQLMPRRPSQRGKGYCRIHSRKTVRRGAGAVTECITSVMLLERHS